MYINVNTNVRNNFIVIPFLNRSDYKMKVDSSLLLVVFLLFIVAVALTDGLRQANVIQQVIKALEHRDDMKQVVKHLEKTEKDLVAELPLIGSSI